MRKFAILLLLTAFISMGSAQIYHEFEASSQGMEANTTIHLECQGENCPVNSWNLNYNLPEDSEIRSIQDSLGKIDDYSYSATGLTLETNTGNRRTEETVKINYYINRSAEEIGEEFYTYNLSIPGFEDTETTGRIKADGLRSGRISHGFESSHKNSILEFKGEGPVRADFNFGNITEESDYYSFTSGVINSGDEAYEIALGAVGDKQGFDRFSVSVEHDFEYEDHGYEWSAGEYRAGHIRIRESSEMRPVLVHETVHGLNDELLSWDRTSSAWFDEGVAKHAENLMEKKLYTEGEIDERPGELFGDEKVYVVDNVRYTTPSRGDRDRLWEYYQNQEDFMKDWRPHDSENRDFGYAYSELVVKAFLYEGGSLQEVYQELELESPITSNEDKWRKYSRYMDLEPCNYERRERFERCLDEINNHSFELRKAEPVDSGNIEIQTIELEERDVQENESVQYWIEKFIEKVEENIANLVT